MKSYALLDTGNRQRLEQWGQYRLIRPDPTATTPPVLQSEWREGADAVFTGTSVTNGEWKQFTKLPTTWPVSMGKWQFLVGLTSSKHVGLFPEQLEQWELISELLTTHKIPDKQLRVLNLFAHTGAASIAAASAGAHTTHVDSSAPAIGRAKENQALNGLDERSIRWIREDVGTFVSRELRRGNTYDLICLDPPAYGHGTKGERFSLQKQLVPLLTDVQRLLSDDSLGVILTLYSDDIALSELEDICTPIFKAAQITAKKLSLLQESNKQQHTTGCWAFIASRKVGNTPGA